MVRYFLRNERPVYQLKCLILQCFDKKQNDDHCMYLNFHHIRRVLNQFICSLFNFIRTMSIL